MLRRLRSPLARWAQCASSILPHRDEGKRNLHQAEPEIAPAAAVVCGV